MKKVLVYDCQLQAGDDEPAPKIIWYPIHFGDPVVGVKVDIRPQPTARKTDARRTLGT
jgi:hypothetical protein